MGSDLRFLETISTSLAEEMDVVTCTSTEQALKLLPSARFQLMCVHLDAPGVNGVELLDRATQLHQTMSGLLITSNSEYSRAHGQNRYHVLVEPFEPLRLRSLALRLAQITEMKRSVQSLTDSVMAPESSRLPPPSSRRLDTPPPSETTRPSQRLAARITGDSSPTSSAVERKPDPPNPSSSREERR
ncbi:response regulator [Chondromyces crocatus]|uniref:response regulator n=1 Tax=Chondromyces crocatus TaxID=52 RepID=UPI00146FF6E5|nr:response regulator [Chondromyces crocatus]